MQTILSRQHGLFQLFGRLLCTGVCGRHLCARECACCARAARKGMGQAPSFERNGPGRGCAVWTFGPVSAPSYPRRLSRSQQHAPNTHVNSGAAGVRPPPLFRHNQTIVTAHAIPSALQSGCLSRLSPACLTAPARGRAPSRVLFCVHDAVGHRTIRP